MVRKSGYRFSERPCSTKSRAIDTVRTIGRTEAAGRNAIRGALALALARCCPAASDDRDRARPGRRRPAEISRRRRQAARRAAGAGLVARLSLARTDHAGRARAARQSRHRGGGRAHRAGRRADAHRGRTAAAGDQFRRRRRSARARAAPRATASARVLNASYEIDFWGKNRAALRSAEFTAIASRFDREVIVLSTVVDRHQHLLPGPRRAGPAAHRAQQRRRGDAHPERLSGAHRGRHRDRPRYRAAGIRCSRSSAPPSRRSISNCARTSPRSRCCSAMRPRG